MSNHPAAARRGQRNVTRYVAHGASVGAAVWLIYGIMESSLTALIPSLWLSHRSTLYQHPLFLVFLFLAYGSAGMISGGVWGWVCSRLHRRSSSPNARSADRLFEAGPLISVLVILALNIALSYDFELSSSIVLVLCGAIGVGVAARAVPHKWAAELGLITNPWSALLVVLGIAWLLLEVLQSHESRLLKASVLVSYPLAVYGISRLARRLSDRWIGAGVPCCRLRIVLPLAALSGLGVYWTYAPGQPLDAGIEGVPSRESFPNIVLIILDTVRADHMSLYGYQPATTPNLAEFAREATLYSRASATSDMTLASHASIFTGLYARSHGARYDPPARPFGVPLSEDFDTLAEFLSDLGYATLGVVANHGYAGRRMNMNQGFQYFDDRRGTPLLAEGHDILVRQPVFEYLSRLLPQSASDMWYRTAEAINEEVFDLLDDVAATDSPFFLFANYMDAHWPYTPPSPYDTLFPGKNESVRNDDYMALMREVHSGQSRVPETWRRHLVSQYDGALAYLDEQVMLLIDKLRALELYDNTLIIITSDHGEAFGRRGLVGHGVSVYQDQVHVPLLVKWPNSGGEGRVHELVSLVDLFPTVVDLLGQKAPQPLPGVSLLELTQGMARHVISESYPNPGMAPRHAHHDRVERALFAGDLELITSSRGKRELYALDQDPNQDHNLFDEEPEEAALLIGWLDDWLAAKPDFLNQELGSDEKLEIDEETLDRLRNLGYIQ